MCNLRLCNAATIRYSLLKFGHMPLCGKDYKYFSPHCCKCNSFGCIAAIRCVNACHGPHSDSVYSGSKHRQFNSPRLVKREADFPNPRRALIGSNQLWRVNDSPYYRELGGIDISVYSYFIYHSSTLKWNQLSVFRVTVIVMRTVKLANIFLQITLNTNILWKCSKLRIGTWQK